VVHISCICPDSTCIVSGSSDDTIRVWDARTGEIVVGPFEGHTDLVRSVAYSPDGTCIISGSYDHTIRVWDAKTGKVVAGPFKGHTESVTSVAYSPDGTCIVSGSYDQSIRVWNAKTGEVVAGPFEGHTDLGQISCNTLLMAPALLLALMSTPSGYGMPRQGRLLLAHLKATLVRSCQLHTLLMALACFWLL